MKQMPLVAGSDPFQMSTLVCRGELHVPLVH